MPGSFFGIGMASQALRGYQRSLDTTGNNIANINTPGYTRQTVEFAQNADHQFYQNGIKFLGGGMHISSINRIRDSYLDQSFNRSNSNFGRFNAMSQTIGQMDGIYGEPSDSGISASLENFFNAWSGLGSNPTDAGARAQVRIAGQELADRIRTTYSDFANLHAGHEVGLNATIEQINTFGDQIATLNREITVSLAAGGSPNSLLDQRDTALEKLSQLVDVQKETFEDGSYVVYAGGHKLVGQRESFAFPSTFDAQAGTLTNGTITITPKNGEIKGLLGGLKAIEDQMVNLDSLANELRTAINTPHQTGTNLLGNTGVNFFNDVLVPPQTGAIDFDLSAEVKADSRAIAAGITGEIGDAGLAQMFGEMRSTQITGLGNQSFGDYFGNLILDLANEGAYFESAKSTEDAVLTQINEQRQAVSGVNLDEEMANMMKFQRSYQAAARALTVFDQVTEDLIGMLRR